MTTASRDSPFIRRNPRPPRRRLHAPTVRGLRARWVHRRRAPRVPRTPPRRTRHPRTASGSSVGSNRCTSSTRSVMRQPRSDRKREEFDVADAEQLRSCATAVAQGYSYTDVAAAAGTSRQVLTKRLQRHQGPVACRAVYDEPRRGRDGGRGGAAQSRPDTDPEARAVRAQDPTSPTAAQTARIRGRVDGLSPIGDRQGGRCRPSGSGAIIDAGVGDLSRPRTYREPDEWTVLEEMQRRRKTKRHRERIEWWVVRALEHEWSIDDTIGIVGIESNHARTIA